jgi:hypothetical protein
MATAQIVRKKCTYLLTLCSNYVEMGDINRHVARLFFARVTSATIANQRHMSERTRRAYDIAI